MLRKVIAFKGKDYCVVLNLSYKGKFWLKLLRINHDIKEEINWKWMWRLWSWLWNVVYMWIVVMCMLSLK